LSEGPSNEVGRSGPVDQHPGTRAEPPQHRGGRRRRKGGGGRDGDPVVPDAVFTSYYGRPVVKASPWEVDIPVYLFLGGVAGGSSLLAAGADLTDRPLLRRATRLAAAGGITVSFAALVHDLGRPARFVNMLRVAKPTSPMSVGTWILTVYGPVAGLAGAAELRNVLPLPGFARTLLGLLARPAGLVAALTGPAVASYTAVLLADTATPSWHEAFRELPFVFVGSAAGASGGLAMIATPLDEAGPARRLAVVGAALELAAEHRMEATMGITAEPLHDGAPGRLMRASKILTATGAVLAAVLGRRSRVASAVAGASLVGGSLCLRLGFFDAGQASARDPKYTVVPQRERLERRARDASA
jgi:hypothetical protein